jgi:glutamate-ammonia-ligase adenylyltransferase
LLDQLRPFVYRRYLDYGTLGALRDVHAMISQQAMRRGAEDNIKIGPGGIRMVEFAVQVQQLIHGGRDGELQQGSLLEALRVLRERRLLPIGHVQVLQQAYRFLRTLENRLQEMQATQTHVLPQAALEQARLAHAMGFSDWPALAAHLDAVRKQVMTIFTEVFATQRATSQGHDTWIEELRLLWQDGLSSGQCAEVLERAGFKDAPAIQHELHALRQSRFVMRLDARGRQWLDQLIPEALLEAAQLGSAVLQQQAMQRLTALLQAIGQRSGYLALMAEHPQVLRHLMRLITASGWIFQSIARQPVLLDELLHPGPVDPHGLKVECHTILQRQLRPGVDLEHAMDAQREFKERAFLSVAAAQLDGRLDAVGVGEALTVVAEHIVQTSLALAWQQWRDRGGASTPPLAVIGYGRLGAGELSYASDLDLVFLGDDMEAMQATALVRRLIHLLSTRTRAGIAFQVDTRLRPSGQAGLLIGTIHGFADYQLHRAWVWEHLALVHSRFVAGDEAAGQRFESLRRSVLVRSRTAMEVWEAVAEMRRRLAAATEGKDDLKRSPGGLLDVRFMAAGMVLVHAAQHPALLEPRGVVPLLQCLEKLGIAPPQALEDLLADYIRLLEAEQRQVLHGATDENQQEELATIRARLARMWDNTPWLA